MTLGWFWVGGSVDDFSVVDVSKDRTARGLKSEGKSAGRGDERLAGVWTSRGVCGVWLGCWLRLHLHVFRDQDLSRAGFGTSVACFKICLRRHVRFMLHVESSS